MGKEKEQTAPEGCPENNTVHSAYRKGDPVLDIYRIESDRFFEGGFGRVYQVHHTGWNVDLAMKKPKPDMFQTEKHKASFKKECENWINLGLHPHIVSCYYVREIDGVPSIFAEWMDGGSLREWIYPQAGEDKDRLYEGTEYEALGNYEQLISKSKEGRLYKGGKEKALERILNISIQTARGLHYANDQGLVHQDVKPENILLSVDGKAKVFTAKVADFGISDARTKVANIESDTDVSKFKSLAVNGYSCTPAYCSPEQALLIQSEKPAKSVLLTVHTDIWSWAVTVLEMFLGDCPWMLGIAAGKYCELYFKKAKIPVPKAMKELLRHCFQTNKADRPNDFGEVESDLLEIYKIETGHAYPRRAPKAAPNSADSLNNKALTFLDLGKPEEAEKYWEDALAIMPNHAESLYNQGIHLWRNARIDDLEALNRLSDNRSFMTDYYIAKIHLSRGDAESAIECLKKAKEILGDSADIEKTMAAALEMIKNGEDGKCIRTFYTGHTRNVMSVCFSPDGKTALSGSSDRTMKLWNVENGQCLHTFEGHTNYVNSVCFSPDGKTALSGSFDATMKLWDVENGQCLRTFDGHAEVVNSVCFSPDGKTALSGSYDHTTKLWNVENGQCLRTFDGHTSFVKSVCFSPDGKTAFSGSFDHTIKHWEVRTGQCIRTFEVTFKGTSSLFSSISFSPDGMTELSCGLDGDMRLCDVETGQFIRKFHVKGSSLSSACFNPDGKTALSCGKNLQLWNVETGQCLRSFEGHTDYVYSVCFSPDGSTALSGDQDKMVNLWRIPTKFHHYEMAHSKPITAEIAFNNAEQLDSLVAEINFLLNKDNDIDALSIISKLSEKRIFGSRLAYVETKKKIAHYCTLNKISDIEQTRLLMLPEKTVSFCVSPNGKTALSGGKDCYVRLWNVASWHCIHVLKGHTGLVNLVLFSPDGKLALTGSRKEIKLWEVMTGKCKHNFEIGSRSYKTYFKKACFDPKGKTFLSVSEREIKLWDVESGKCIHTFDFFHEVRSVCFSPDGKVFLSAGKGGIELWDVKIGKCVHSFKGNKYTDSDVSSVCFSPDGKVFLSAGRRNIQLWDVTMEEVLKTFDYDFAKRVAICFSPNGKMAISISDNDPVDIPNTLKIWNIETGQCIFTSNELNYKPSGCTFSPDGTQIIVESTSGIHIFDIDYDLEFPGWQEWDEGARPYLEIFLTLHPNWTDEDFNCILIPDLQNRGYGWLRPEGVRAELRKMTIQALIIMMETPLIKKRIRWISLFIQGKSLIIREQIVSMVLLILLILSVCLLYYALPNN